MDKRLKAFENLLNIMDELRAKCPWDKEQTTESLRHLTIEEMYELSEAVIKKDKNEIEKELGDLLLHIVFYAKIGQEEGDYDITSVIDKLCAKLIRRHPHIYGEVNAGTSEQVKKNWEQIKLAEKENSNIEEPSVLSGVPMAMPSLVKALRMQEKAAQVGFDWDTKEQVWEKVQEEWKEFETATEPDKKAEEFGDILFALVNYARFENINPDDALERTNHKFYRRFRYLEKCAATNHTTLIKAGLETMTKWWDEAKANE